MSYVLRSSLKQTWKHIHARRNSFSVTSSNLIRLSSFSSIHQRGYAVASIFPEKQKVPKQHSLETHLKKLDLDARKLGRIPFTEVAQVLKKMKAGRVASSSQSLLVIRCCGNLISEESPSKRTELVKEIWDTLQKLGVRMDVSHYNALLRVYLENKYEFSPTEILREMEERGIEPNRVTYQRLIMRYCQAGDIEGATRILEFMKEKEIPINENVFNALILGHSQSNNMESAEGIISVMKAAGIDPSADTYTILICGYIKQKNIEKIYSLLSECEKQDIYFIDKDYLEIIYNLSINGLDDEIDKLKNKIRKSTGYNQEAVNYIYQLMAADKCDAAFKILQTMVRPTRPDGTLVPTGGFFISQLCRLNKPVEVIVRYCEEIAKEMNPNAFNVAMESSLRHGNENTALALFRLAKEKNIPIRQHYFWPLLVNRGKAGQVAGILDLVSIMDKEFGLKPSTETVREYVVPYLLQSRRNYNDIILDLKSCGISTAASVSSLVICLLQNKEIKPAAEIAAAYKAFYSPYLIRRPLISAFWETRDMDSLVILLKQIAAGIQWKAISITETDKQEDEDQEIPEHQEYIGYFVVDILKQTPSDLDRTQFTETFLSVLLENGIRISGRSAQFIQNSLQSKLTDNITTLLEKLTDEDLVASPLPRSLVKMDLSSGDETTLERMLENMEAKGESTKGIKKQLFTIYAKNRNLEKLLKIKKELEDDEFVFTDGMKAMLIDTYVYHRDLESALKEFEDILEKVPDFTLNPTKLMRLLCLLVENDQYEKALEFLDRCDAMVDENSEETSYVRSMLGWRFLNALAEKCGPDIVKKAFNILISRKFAEPNNVLLGPLIKAHVLRNDINGALNEFENCCLKYRFTPWKNELANKFIEAEDAVNLQRLTDLSTQVHGEVNSLYDLMLSFLECGRIKQAKKILQTPGLMVRHDRLRSAYVRYQTEGAIKHLESLLDITKDVNSLDRGDLYYNLILSYDKENDSAKALALWTRMQEEDEYPTDDFLIALAKILKRNELPVTFEVPTRKTKNKVNDSFDSPKLTVQTKELRRLMHMREIDRAIEFQRKHDPHLFSAKDLSAFLQILVGNGKLREAKQMVLDLLPKKIQFYEKSLKIFFGALMTSGDVDAFEQFEPLLTEKQKSIVFFNNRKCRAYMNANRSEEFLTQLENQLDNLSDEESIHNYLVSLPKGGLITMLEVKPHLYPRIKDFCFKCLEKGNGNVVIMNVLWTHHMLQKEYVEAEKIWEQYLKNSDQLVLFKAVLAKANDTMDIASLQKLLSMLKEKKGVTSSSLGVVYGSMISVYTKDNRVEEAVQVLKDALKEVSLKDIYRKSLEVLQTACSIKGIPFDYTIPKYVKFDESSGDSTEDESK